MRCETVTLAVAVVIAMACGGQREVELAPAKPAMTFPGDAGRALAQEAGIRLTVDAKAWGGDPSDLDEKMVPVQVTIQNQSGRPVRLSYDAFSLVTPDGKRFEVVSPFRIDGSEQPIVTPMLTYDRFAVAARHAPFYPGVEVWPDSITPAEQVTANRWNTTWSDRLPTAEMLSLALPEGVLRPGGEISGFLYFEDVAEDVRRVEFRAELDHARTGSELATLAIPMVELDRRS